MAYYEELSPIVNNVIMEKMLRNQNICKLLTYYPDVAQNDREILPLLDYSVYEQPDIENTAPLFLNYIYPFPKMPDTKTQQKTYVTVVMSGGYDAELNTGFRRLNMLVDIVCHVDAWYVREGYRPYLIMHELDKMLNNQQTDLPIFNKPYSRGFQPRDYSRYYYGIQMIYTFNISSNVDCNGLPQNINLDDNATSITLPTPTFKRVLK